MNTSAPSPLEMALVVSLERAIRLVVSLLPLVKLLAPSLCFSQRRRLLRALDRLQNAQQGAEATLTVN